MGRSCVLEGGGPVGVCLQQLLFAFTPTGRVGCKLKVAGVGMLVTVVAQILGKAGRDEQAMLVSIAGIVLVLLLLVEEIGSLITQVRGVFGF